MTIVTKVKKPTHNEFLKWVTQEEKPTKPINPFLSRLLN